MSSIKKFGIFPSIAMIALSVGLINHVLLGPLLLDSAKRDAWMVVPISLLIILPWLLVPFTSLLSKLKRKRFDVWLKEHLPPWVVRIIMIYFMILLIWACSETLIISSSWAGTTYLPRTPTVIISVVFLTLCLYAAHKGLRSIAYLSCILLLIVSGLGLFVMAANIPHKDYLYLLPILENGPAPVMQAVVYGLTSFSEFVYVLLFQHHVTGSYKRKHLILLVLFLTLLAVGPVMGAISEFGPVEAEKMRYPAFAQWRLVSIGKYFEHVDFFAIYQWLSGALIRISLALYLIVEYSSIKRMKRPWIGYMLLGIGLAGLAYLGIHHMILYTNVIFHVYKWYGILTISLVLLLYAASFLRKRGDHDGQPQHRPGGAEEQPA
ncbi:endospore germination permease [Paenibacillus sp. PL2-23]|uniref:GerAB/ArcD/ProY family transporter n=1 Tax=Paenibacillus sp. PL2-23 TaxID=2100729 RepID=UPI0030FBFBB8